jgi:WD40 repeat protein
MRRILILVPAMLALAARPAHAWDHLGHRLVARVAWQNLTPTARARAISILQGAPADAGLLRSFPSGPLTAAQQLRLFQAAANWPDSIRSSTHPGHKYAVAERHFIDLFWEQDSDFGPPMTSTHPEDGTLLADLPGLRSAVTGPDAAQAAISLAWIIHLVGDVHQPLHGSSRITPVDPNGDRGGNDFHLTSASDNLHHLWDAAVTTAVHPRSGESQNKFEARIARQIAAAHPRSEFTAQLADTDPRHWATESQQLAQTAVYRPPLVRGHAAPASYSRTAYRTAQGRIALAGYRLADVLNQLLS